MSNTTEQTGSLKGYPNISAAAAMLGVSVATLSRRDDLARLRRGDRDIALAPGEVLRLASIYRKRSLNDVAQGLLDHAEQTAPEELGAVEAEVERFFEERAPAREEKERFRELARQLLPADLAGRVEAILDEKGEALPDMVQGYMQPPPQS
jgi:hypothetical protein